MNDNLHQKTRWRGGEKEEKGEKGWEMKRGREKKRACLCNRWSESSLTAGECERLPQSDKWLSCSQTAGRTGKRQYSSAVKQQRGKTFVCSERSTVTMDTMVNNIRFTQHKSTRETVLNTSTQTRDRKRRSEGERGKNKDKYTGPVAKSRPVSIGIYFGLSSFSLAAWIIHDAGVCRNYSTAVDETKLQGCTAGETTDIM